MPFDTADINSIMRAFVFSTFVLVACTFSTAVAKPKTDEASRQKYAKMFRPFDSPEEVMDEIDCYDDLDNELCPMEDDSIPCGGSDAVSLWCREVLGEDIVSAEEGKETGKGLNAVRGCLMYVSWDDDAAICCPSEYCWDNEEGWDDDDMQDGDLKFEDDDSFEDEF